jgi:hypothetical protein
LERRRSRHSHPQRSQGRIRQAANEVRALTYLVARHSIPPNDWPNHLPLPYRREARGRWHGCRL